MEGTRMAVTNRGQAPLGLNEQGGVVFQVMVLGAGLLRAGARPDWGPFSPELFWSLVVGNVPLQQLPPANTCM